MITKPVRLCIEATCIDSGRTDLRAARSLLIICLAAVSCGGTVAAQANAPAVNDARGIDTSEYREYDADFFARYKPSTALDMVVQLPGFQIDDGDSSRGFGAALGNVLINGHYPSAKNDSPTALLSRIPYSQVARIELIRGQASGIDLQGQVMVTNVILREGAGTAVQWEASYLDSNVGPGKPGINVSVTDRWRAIEYIAGLDLERGANGEYGNDLVLDADGQIAEIRVDRERETGTRLTGLILNAATSIGKSLVQINTKFGYVGGPDTLTSDRIPQMSADGPRSLLFVDEQSNPSWELGVDAERSIGDHATGKAILLFTWADSEVDSTQKNFDDTGAATLLRNVVSGAESSETIARYEFDWRGLPDHVLQINGEVALNSLRGTFSQTDDTGDGPMPVEVPGANSRVREVRGDVEIKDTWSLGDFELDYGLGAENSEITQTGDVELKRSFSYLKPQGAISYSARSSRYRLGLAREVAQLDFDEFVSATVLKDDDLALGNPNLEPETTWIAELSQERRFSQDSAYTLTLFYNWISDVQDLLPLTEEFEAPGNIGNGYRWGVKLESTVPLDLLGMDNAKLDIKMRWQDSAVTDPVTGKQRQLTANCCFRGPPDIKQTSENDYVFDLAFRQDLENARVAWGWDLAEQAERPRFLVNELEVYDEGVELNAFIETTRWWGIKLRFEGRNLANYSEQRDRIRYSGNRELTPVDSLILRNRFTGRRLQVVLSGSF